MAWGRAPPWWARSGACLSGRNSRAPRPERGACWAPCSPSTSRASPSWCSPGPDRGHARPMARAKGNSVVVVGSSNTDMIVRVARVPRPGETLLGGEFITAAGGKGANQAVAAARAGGRTALVARLGSDSLGDQALAGFRREGLDVSRVVRDRAH